MSPMKILIYTHSFAPIIGGAERYVVLLGQGLSSHTHSEAGIDVEVTVVTPTPSGNFDDSKLGFRVVRQPKLSTLVALIWKSDVVQLAGPCFLPLLVAWLLRKPIVVEHHGYPPACPNGLLFYEPSKAVCPGYFLARRYDKCLRCNACTEGWLKSVRMLFLTFPRRWLCQHVAVNAPISEHVRLRLKLPRSQVIYYGIPDASAERESRLITPSNVPPPCFAYVGRLVSLKGLPSILEAAKSLQMDGYAFRLKFVGDGPEQPELRRLTEKLDLGKYVEFTGFITGTAAQAAMHDVAAVLMPSVWEETAGLAAIEQMMRGRLVIASDIGGLGEVVGDCGLLFPAGNAKALAQCMMRVLDNPEIIAQYGAAARRRAVGLFSQQRMVKEHVDLYRRLAGLPDPGHESRCRP